MLKKKAINLIIGTLFVLSVMVVTFIWPHLDLNISNVTGATGSITQQNYSTDSDTVRYVIFISFPLIIFFLSFFYFKKEKVRSFYDLIRYPHFEEQKKFNIKDISLLLLIFIILEFISLGFPLGPIDTFHDGELLSVAKNSLLTKSFFIDTYTIHGLSDIFYPLAFWKIFNQETIGAGRSFFLFLILALKFLTIVLAYQISKFSFVKNKKIFFIFFSLILISMSYYQVPINFSYFSYRDIFIIIFLIFFSHVFLKQETNLLIKFMLGLVPSIALIMHIDTGTFLFVLLFSYIFYLLINKKTGDIFTILISISITWIFLILFFGLEEISNFFKNAITIILSMDYLHGIIYPEPFLSIGENKNGMRGTRGLLLQLFAGLFVLYHFISKKNNLSNNGKLFFVFLFFLSFIMYKNALGRSDSYHIRMSNDLPILINVFFILNIFLNYFEKKFNLGEISNKKNLIFLIILLNLFYLDKFNYQNMLKFKSNLMNFVALPNSSFMDNKKKNFVNTFKELSKNDTCVQNFTDDLILIYLIEKPSCSKFVASWLASPLKLQDEYIESIHSNKPNYIIYDSPYFKVDNIPMSDRLVNVNNYILENYEFFDSINDYKILKIKN